MNAPNAQWNRDALLSANSQLNRVYQHDADPCIALMILRNYHLLLAQSSPSDEHQEWREKAKIWLQRYTGARANNNMGVFYDESGLFYDVI